MANFMPVAMEIFGSLTKAYGAYSSGQGQQEAAKFEAKQLRMNADKAKAVGHRAAQEDLRQTQLVQSRILALASASGAGASDPTIVRLIGRQAGEGAYRAAMSIYKGDDKARDLTLAAKAREYEGKVAASIGTQKAINGLVSTGMSLYDRFSQGGPVADSSGEVYADDWWGTGELKE